MSAKVICITNQKGGVGKTTTAVNLSYFLAKAHKKVLLIDFDPQGNATSGLGIDKASDHLGITMSEIILGLLPMTQAIRATSYKNFDLAPATPELANTEVEITSMDNHKFVCLRNAVASVASSYDYIIIDSPPSLSLLTVNGMIASHYLLLPVQTEFYALEGVAQLLESMKLVQKSANPHLRLLGVVATMFDRRTALSAQVFSEIKKYFKDLTFETTIPRNVRVAEAPSHGVPVGAYDSFSKGAKAYKDLAKEVIERTK